MNEAVIVVPCFEEAKRLDAEAFAGLAGTGGIHLLFVDDGSRDGTLGLLEGIAARLPDTVAVLSLRENAGKAEAVRAGLLRAMEQGAEVVGYLDADLSAPPSEMVRLVEALRAASGVDVVLGSRVMLLGRRIERLWTRHLLGRAFATAASMALQLPVYDTQCGAKVFRTTTALRSALGRPFSSRWAFDVELLARLLTGGEGVAPVAPERFLEVPLTRWHHVRGSKLKPSAMAQAGLDLLQIARDRRR